MCFYLFIVIVSAKITDYFHINRYMAKKSREIPFDNRGIIRGLSMFLPTFVATKNSIR